MRHSFALVSLVALCASKAIAGDAFIRERGASGAACRAATPEETAILEARPTRIPLHVLIRGRETLAASAGLHIVLRGTDQLEAKPEAKAAFLRAAARWESLISSPVTIVLDVDYGDLFFGSPFLSGATGQTIPQFARFDWPTVRGTLVAGADTPARKTLASALPIGTIPSDRGPIGAIRAPAPVFRALGLLPSNEDPANEGSLDPPAQIGFRSDDYWDFDPTDGINPYWSDFDAVVMHEIGHALGFVSRIGGSPPLAVSLLDVYRFRPSATPPDLGSTPRVASSGGNQVFFAGGAQLALSTKGLDGAGGGNQADHWHSEWLEGSPIGVMDPGGYWYDRVVVTGRDLAALDAMGWKTVGTPPAEPSVRTIPIVLDVSGVGGVRFTTELTLSSRSIAPAEVELSYTPAAALGASGGGTATTSLPAHGQLLIPDALGWLRDHGVAVPASGNQGGTLKVTFRGDDCPIFFSAGGRTTAPAGSGRAGLAYPAIRQQDGIPDSAVVFGLRENAADRSNLALLNMGAAPVTLRVKLFSGSADGRSATLPDVMLDAGQWTQLSRVLAGPGYANGWAVVDLVAGAGPFAAYGVFNDNATNDGSFVPAVRNYFYKEAQYVPVLVETPAFTSELIVTNLIDTPVTALIAYVESLNPQGGAGGKATLSLAPYEQRILPSAVDWLRTHGVALGARGAGSYAGSASVTISDSSGVTIALAGARTSASGDGGSYGLFTPGISWTRTDYFATWVYGLKQDATSRSNLAVLNVGDDDAAMTFHVNVYDGDTGVLAGRTSAFTLAPLGWKQFDSVLAAFGLRSGYAEVVAESDSRSFIAYGVVNDGSTPSSGRTNDGSYVASSKY
jgi:hypothetical protein